MTTGNRSFHVDGIRRRDKRRFTLSVYTGSSEQAIETWKTHHHLPHDVGPDTFDLKVRSVKADGTWQDEPV